MANSFGTVFRITTFGESHGHAMGVVIDGCPAGIYIDSGFIQTELTKRRPGQSPVTTARNESDQVTVLSGVLEGRSTGAPITLLVENKDQRSQDYSGLKNVYRPSHADYTWEMKYGIRDFRGGGRSSARETVARVAAGAVAQLLLREYNISIYSYVSQVGNVKTEKHYSGLDLNTIEQNIIRCPDQDAASDMIALIEELKDKGDTVGGTVSCVIKGCAVGLGEPVFDKLNARLAYAMLGINAAHGFDYGDGFEGINKYGSEQNDEYILSGDKITTKTNHSGGIQGGLSNGQDIYFRVLFKPVSTIMKEQNTVNSAGEEISFKAAGRHDPCVLPRAVPVVQAMAALVLTDLLLLNRFSKVGN